MLYFLMERKFGTEEPNLGGNKNADCTKESAT